MRARVLALALALSGLFGCAETSRAAAADLSTKAALIVARGVVRAVGLCDDAPPALDAGAPMPGDGGAPDR